MLAPFLWAIPCLRNVHEGFQAGDTPYIFLDDIYLCLLVPESNRPVHDIVRSKKRHPAHFKYFTVGDPFTTPLPRVPVHTLHMPKAVITFVFKVLRDGLLPHILYTCPNL